MKSHDRSPDQTILGVSMPKTLKEKIAQAAKKEKRSMANWCVNELTRIVDDLDAKQQIESPRLQLLPDKKLKGSKNKDAS